MFNVLQLAKFTMPDRRTDDYRGVRELVRLMKNGNLVVTGFEDI
jgi:hypothetical protein